MVKTYNCTPENPEKSSKTKALFVRVHFKNTVETARCIRGMTLKRAKKYLNNVLRKTETVAFKRFTAGPGRNAQAKNWKTSQGRWPAKSAYTFLKLLRNCEANAVKKGLDKSKLYISHSMVTMAPHIRRRTFRAHGRINAFKASPSHIQLFLSEQQTTTSAPADVPSLEETKQ